MISAPSAAARRHRHRANDLAGAQPPPTGHAARRTRQWDSAAASAACPTVTTPWDLASSACGRRRALTPSLLAVLTSFWRFVRSPRNLCPLVADIPGETPRFPASPPDANLDQSWRLFDLGGRSPGLHPAGGVARA